MWYDGRCKKCDSDVEEGSDKITGIRDYQNRCTNTKCEEHKWHFVFDNEFLDYYIHKQE